MQDSVQTTILCTHSRDSFRRSSSKIPIGSNQEVSLYMPGDSQAGPTVQVLEPTSNTADTARDDSTSLRGLFNHNSSINNEDIDMAARPNASVEPPLIVRGASKAFSDIESSDSIGQGTDYQNEEELFHEGDTIMDNKDTTMRRVVTEIDSDLQELFPLSARPWRDAVIADGLQSACPPNAVTTLPARGLIAEADCIVNVAQAIREVREAEERLAKCRAKESMLRARLYQIQAAMAIRLKQLSLTQVGRARADRARRLTASPMIACN